MIIIARADPIICRHAAEARNLAEAALQGGFEQVRIVTWPLATILESTLPCKQLSRISPYSEGIVVDRPEALAGSQVLDGRLLQAMTGHVSEMLMDGVPTTIVSLYLVPHAQVAVDAVQSVRRSGVQPDVHTIAEAVGSDVTGIVRCALASGHFGAAQQVLGTFLANDCPVAVSEYTRSIIIDHATEVDHALGTHYAPQMGARLRVSYPAIDTASFINAESNRDLISQTLARYRLLEGKFILFLSRVLEAKGVADLIEGYRRSKLYGMVPLVIAGTGDFLEQAQALATGDEQTIMFLGAVDEQEKRALMHGCGAFALPTKSLPDCTATFAVAIAEKMLSGGSGPVITTRVGGACEATGDHCLYVSPGRPDEIAASLERALLLMSLDARRELSESARSYAMQFDCARVLNNLLGTLLRAA